MRGQCSKRTNERNKWTSTRGRKQIVKGSFTTEWHMYHVQFVCLQAGTGRRCEQDAGRMDEGIWGLKVVSVCRNGLRRCRARLHTFTRRDREQEVGIAWTQSLAEQNQHVYIVVMVDVLEWIKDVHGRVSARSTAQLGTDVRHVEINQEYVQLYLHCTCFTVPHFNIQHATMHIFSFIHIFIHYIHSLCRWQIGNVVPTS